MLGIEGFWVSLAYALCLLSALLCIFYGLINWNRGAEDAAPSPRDVTWEKEEREVEKTIEP
jgi:hypothetical protein